MRVSTRRSLPEQIAARIHEQISDGTYPAGSQLPLQKELAHHFGVSVSVVRESLALLAAGGLVWSRAGTGTFVSADAYAALRFPMWVREPSSPDELAECLEARDLLARSAVALAARRRDAGDVARLRATLAKIEAAATRRRGLRAGRPRAARRHRPCGPQPAARGRARRAAPLRSRA